MSELLLPPALARLIERLGLNSAPDELADSIVEAHGGRSAMLAMHYEIVFSMVRVFTAMRGAKPEELPALVSSLHKLESMLPTASSKAERSPLERLHDHCATHGAPS